MEGIWEQDISMITFTDSTATEQMKHCNCECKNTKGKNQEEHLNFADDTNNDCDKVAHTLVDSELEQLIEMEWQVRYCHSISKRRQGYTKVSVTLTMCKNTNRMAKLRVEMWPCALLFPMLTT
jgi:hypothetical protein